MALSYDAGVFIPKFSKTYSGKVHRVPGYCQIATLAITSFFLRVAPSEASEALDCAIHFGEILHVEERSGNWVKVTCRGAGWVPAALINEVNEKRFKSTES